MINSTQQRTTGQLVKAHREGANMSLSELSETTGISRSTLNAWETGANAVHRTWPRHRDSIKRIALAIGVSESLLWGDEPEPANPVASFAGPIPVAEGEYSGIFVDRGHAAGETMAVSAAVSVHIDECYRVVGSSMSPRIRHGDIIGVKAASTPAHGVLHVVCQEGLVGIYETVRKNGAWTLWSTGPEGKIGELSGSVFGRVTYIESVLPCGFVQEFCSDGIVAKDPRT